MRCMLFALLATGCVTVDANEATETPGGKADGGCLHDPTGVLATNQAWPRSLVVDDARVYWATADGTIAATDRCGGGVTEVLATGQSSPQSVVVAGANIYWVNYASGGDGDVMAMAAAGGAPVSLAVVRGPLGVVVDDASAYVLALDGLYRVPLAGGAASLVAPATCPHGGPWRTGSDLVWSEDCVMFGAPRVVRFAGGVASTLVADEAPESLAIVDGAAYWTTWASGGPRVRTVALSGGAPSTLATLSGFASSITADASHLFVGGEAPGGDRAVLAVPRGGGAPAVLASVGNPVPSLDAFDGVVYFAEQGQAGTINAVLAP